MAALRVQGHSSSSPVDKRLIYVIDDHPAMCESIEALLCGQGFSVECFSDPVAFVAQSGELASGVVLLDLRMPGMSGLEVLSAIESCARRLPAIMITGHGEIDDAVRAIKAGAKDFIQKPFKSELLVDILNKEWRALKAEAANQADEISLTELSPREKDVVLGLAKGKPNKVIAHELGISIRTVEMHRARAMSRLGCKSLADLLRAVFRQSGQGQAALDAPGSAI